MLKIIKAILFFPALLLKGIYKCLCYGTEDQLFGLMITLAVFFINIKCNTKTDFEDITILITFITIMHYFSKLERENLYLQKYGAFSKVIASMLHRQRKSDEKFRVYVREVEKQVKKIGSPKITEAPKTIFIVQKPQKELPKKEDNKQPQQSDTPKYPIIELGENEYKRVDENENNETEE
jgi:cell division protein ZapA (FtsZ GTPase activity inhibitor)